MGHYKKSTDKVRHIPLLSARIADKGVNYLDNPVAKKLTNLVPEPTLELEYTLPRQIVESIREIIASTINK